MVLRIEEAKQLYNAIQEVKNVKGGKPSKTGWLYNQDLAEHLFPDTKKESAIVNMSNISRGRKKGATTEQIIKIANFFNVDCNFLLGEPSKYDGVYNSVIGK